MAKEEKNTTEVKPVKPKFIFDKTNYILLLASVITIAIGFMLMSGTSDIYNSLKTTVAPIIVLIGFGIGVYAIMKKPNQE